METNNSNKMHYASNLEVGLDRELFVPKTVNGPSQHPNSALKIDANRGPQEFKPHITDYSSQSNNYAAAFTNNVMPNTNLPFGSSMAYNGSARSFETIAQASQISNPTRTYNQSANPNRTMPSINQDYPVTETYNPYMNAEGTFLQTPTAYQATAQY